MEQDHPDPKEVWTAADEVDDGHNPQQNGPPRKSEK
jgi:hypothetical protein